MKTLTRRAFSRLAPAAAVAVVTAGAGACEAVAGLKDDTDGFHQLVLDTLKAWESGDLNQVRKFYAGDADLVFFDWAGKSELHDTGERRGWEAFATSYARYLHKTTGNVHFELGPDLHCRRRGDVAYGTATSKVMVRLPRAAAGADLITEGRHTLVWERREGSWLIVHEHVSIPMPVELLFLQ